MTGIRSVALIGFGEVGVILARDLAKAGVSEIAAYDLKFEGPENGPSRAVAGSPARRAGSHTDAAKGADLVISAVTAASTEDAARSTAPGLEGGAFFLDLNSASPGQKRGAAALVEAAGGRYVEAAVMTSVPPKGIASQMLLGGPHAETFLALATPLGFKAKAFSEVVGQASAAKMCRSVLIKGVEALLMESLLTARSHGVEETVLSSLSDLLPHPDWERQARYMISRSLEHGKRRAEEMGEAARTVGEAGVEPLMAEATVTRQAWAGLRYQELPQGVFDEADLAALLDAIAALPRER